MLRRSETTDGLKMATASGSSRWKCCDGCSVLYWVSELVLTLVTGGIADEELSRLL